MTTIAAENFYLASHLLEMENRGWAIFNPLKKEISELPVIYGFNNGGSPGWYSAIALAEDGTCLGGHVCSHEGYMEHDLGILSGTREDRHKNDYQKHYPDGYRMIFVASDDIDEHEGLKKALKLANEKSTEPTKQS